MNLKTKINKIKNKMKNIKIFLEYIKIMFYLCQNFIRYVTL